MKDICLYLSDYGDERPTCVFLLSGLNNFAAGALALCDRNRNGKYSCCALLYVKILLLLMIMSTVTMTISVCVVDVKGLDLLGYVLCNEW